MDEWPNDVCYDSRTSGRGAWRYVPEWHGLRISRTKTVLVNLHCAGRYRCWCQQYDTNRVVKVEVGDWSMMCEIGKCSGVGRIEWKRLHNDTVWWLWMYGRDADTHIHIGEMRNRIWNYNIRKEAYIKPLDKVWFRFGIQVVRDVYCLVLYKSTRERERERERESESEIESANIGNNQTMKGKCSRVQRNGISPYGVSMKEDNTNLGLLSPTRLILSVGTMARVGAPYRTGNLR